MRTVTVLGCLVALGCELPKAHVNGAALDADSLEPLSDVTLTWNGQSTTTGSDGRYGFEMPVGVHQIQVSHNKQRLDKVVVVTDPEGRSEQRQDLLVRSSAAPKERWMVAFEYVPSLDESTASGIFQAQVLSTDGDGNEGEFLALDNLEVNYPQWDNTHEWLYFAESNSRTNLFRHDTTTDTSEAVRCEGLEGGYISTLCVSPDGNTGFVLNKQGLLVLQGLAGSDCRAVPLEGVQLAFTDVKCSFDNEGSLYLPVWEDEQFSRRSVRRVDTSTDDWSLRSLPIDADWTLRNPVALADGNVLVERVQDAGKDGSVSETWLVDWQMQEKTKLSETPVPVDLVGRRLYFIDHGLWVLDLDSGKRAVLINSVDAASHAEP